MSACDCGLVCSAQVSNMRWYFTISNIRIPYRILIAKIASWTRLLCTRLIVRIKCSHSVASPRVQEHHNGGVRADSAARRDGPGAAAILRPRRCVRLVGRAARHADARLALDDVLMRSPDDHLLHRVVRTFRVTGALSIFTKAEK